ncbi:MAG: translation elongation factor Ts [Pseudomonadota bacterium]
MAEEGVQVEITAALVKELRERTGAGMMDCKDALRASDGDLPKAVDHLRQKGMATAARRAGRQASEGQVHAYIHPGGKIGVLIEVNCESDFVAKSEPFLELAKNLAMQVAAANPLCLRPEDVPAEVLDKEREIYAAQAREEGKPDKVAPKIVEGRVAKFYKSVCLLDQPYVRDDKLSVQDVLNEAIGKIGEKIVVKRFVRYSLGEAIA